MEKKTYENLEIYKVQKYFYSNKNPENFFNLIDKNEWTSERFDTIYHNCIHCINEYLNLNNIKPIPFGFGSGIAYDYLCDKCYKELGRDKMYKKFKMSCYKTFYQIYTKDGDICDNNSLDESKRSEFDYICEKCMGDSIVNWKYDEYWLKMSEEESILIILELEIKENLNEGIEIIKKKGEELALKFKEGIENIKKKEKELDLDLKESFENIIKKGEELVLFLKEDFENIKKKGEKLVLDLIESFEKIKKEEKKLGLELGFEIIKKKEKELALEFKKSFEKIIKKGEELILKFKEGIDNIKEKGNKLSLDSPVSKKASTLKEGFEKFIKNLEELFLVLKESFENIKKKGEELVLGLKEGFENIKNKGEEPALDFIEKEEFKKNRKKLNLDFKEEKLKIKDEKLNINLNEIIEKFKKIGEPLIFALISVKIKNIPKYQYAIVRKNLFEGTGEEKKNYGFIALVSLHENKIIEYGNEKYNNGSPVLREIELEDNYIYHIVKKFQLDKNIDELFYSINLTPWTGKRYDIFYYNSYNFINIYLNKYHQKLI